MQSSKIRDLQRLFINYSLRNKLNNKREISIISSNCIGGVICHELGLKFNSPTINLFFEPDSYLKLVSNLRYYLSLPVYEVPMDNEHNYPRGCIDNQIIIHFLHYESFEEAKKKWIERSKRVNYQNLFFILAERDGLTEDQMKYFDKLPIKHKVILTVENHSDIECVHSMGKTYSDGNQLIDLCRFKTKFSGRRYIDDFDYVAFLNQDCK